MEEKKQSRFDKFIHEFASQNLETRVKIVSFIALFLVIMTVGGAGYLLTRSFQIIETGKVALIDSQKIQISLPIKYEKLITPQLRLMGNVKKKGMIKFDYEIQDFDIKENLINLTLLVKKPKDELKKMKEFQYKLYLEDKSYLQMLFEKTD